MFKTYCGAGLSGVEIRRMWPHSASKRSPTHDLEYCFLLDRWGRTPLDEAVMFGHQQVEDYLRSQANRLEITAA